MLSVNEHFDLFYGESFVESVERRNVGYEVFLYKNTEDSYIVATVQTNLEDLEFLGSIFVPADPQLVLIDRRSELVSKLYDKIDSICAAIAKPYSGLEKETWEQQESEAKALKAVKTPLIDALCAVRGCSRDELAEKILLNSESARRSGTNLLSMQQSIEEEIKKMTLEEFSVLWEKIERMSL